MIVAALPTHRHRCRLHGRPLAAASLLTWMALTCAPLSAAVNVYLTEVPDYEWHAGCFGTATGNLMGYWDRHGFPNFYTGPTGSGLAPLDSYGDHYGIRALWATKAGVDGRPKDKPGHEDDYYSAYESTGPDPYLLAGRPEHEPDCLGDFTGLNQNKWKNLNGECDGNIDGFSFVYWDASGERRTNFNPGLEAGLPAADIQSGLRAWTHFRGYAADVFTQLSDFNPRTPRGKGFTFADLRAEIDAGYPVLLFMQDFAVYSRSMPGMPRANPIIHGMLAYGYYIDDVGTQFVRYRTSWASGDNQLSPWTADNWTPEGVLNLPLRGVIGYHPRPQIVAAERQNGSLTLRWHGPASQLLDAENGVTLELNWYQVEEAASLTAPNFAPVGPPSLAHELSVPAPPAGTSFFRVKLLPPSP